MTLPFWNAGQVVVWITTRDRAAAENASSDIDSPEHQRALAELVAQCGFGRIIALGLRQGAGRATKIEPLEWAYLEIRHDPSHSRIVAAYPVTKQRQDATAPRSAFARRLHDRSSGVGKYWSELKFDATVAQRIWPSSKPSEVPKGSDSQRQRGQKPATGTQMIDDEKTLDEIRAEILTKTARSVRQATIKRIATIEGASEVSTVRRITRKYNARYG